MHAAGSMASILVAVLTIISVSSVRTSNLDMASDIGRYDNGLMIQDLYKHLSDIDPAYFLQREDYTDDDVDNSDTGDAMTDQSSPEVRGQTDIRDSEYVRHSSNAGSQGFIHMSGGAGEGKQHLTPSGEVKNIHQVKSDESLPFYCHPPNPCPKGYTAEEHNCHESIEDTAEVQKAWIEKMMQKGLCNCDEEHMFNCPTGSEDQQTSDMELNDMLNGILNDKQQDNSENPFIGGQKRQTLVAKKSPRVKRDSADVHIESELDKLAAADKKSVNPYLGGEKLPTVAKKGFVPKHSNLN